VKIEDIRKNYLPDKVKILFVGESAPESGKFFYKGDLATTFTQKAFEKVFNCRFNNHQDFLSFFKGKGCYLDDLSLIPVNNMNRAEREATLESGVDSFSKRLESISPDIIIVIMKKIKKHVSEAIGKSKLDNVCVHSLPFPGYGHQNKYENGLVEILKTAIKNQIMLMPDKDNILISALPHDQKDILYKISAFQKMSPGKFLIQEPWPYDELDEDEVDILKEALKEFMPLDTIVTDLWDWDIDFEDRTFEDNYFDVALGAEEYALAQAKFLKEDFLEWIDEYGIDYDQTQWDEEKEFDNWIYDECVKFIKGWRLNIAKAFA